MNNKMRMSIFVFGFIFFIIISVNFVSAEILLGQTESVYNVGDKLDLDIKVNKAASEDDFLKVDLVCNDNAKVLLQIPLSVSAGTQKEIDEELILTNSLLDNMRGGCHLEARFSSDFARSADFKISDYIDVTLSSTKTEILPGEGIVVSGTAVKENAEKAEGFVELGIKNTSINLKTPVVDGEFSTNFSFSKTASSGSYLLEARVYEKDKNNEIANEGIENLKINIRQSPSKIEVAIMEQSVSPGENISFKVFIYDQANSEVGGDVSVMIKDAYEDVIWERLVKTDKLITIPLSANTPPGYWKIEAKQGNLQVTRLFYVGEAEKAKFELINDTLIITNTGNVPYRKAVQIAIDNEVEIKQLDLDVGASRRLRLLAPEGSYHISVTDGTNSLTRGNVQLTGNIIGVMDVRKQVGIIQRYPVVWLFLVVVFGLFVLMTVERATKNKLSFRKPNILKSKPRKANVEKINPKNIKQKTEITTKWIEAEQSLVLKGNKEENTIIAIKTEEDEGLDKRLEDLFIELKEKKAAIAKLKGFYLILFSPTLTKTFKNQVEAVKIALAIQNVFDKEKINYNISVHLGELITKFEQGKLKFTSIGDTLTKSKKIANLSEKEVLLSKELHEKTLSEIKTDKKVLDNVEVFTVKRISERDKYKKFIENFKKKYNE